MALGLSIALASASLAPTIIIPPTPAAYQAYLSHAVIWRDPGPLTAADVRNGPAAPLPNAIALARAGTPLECRFDARGEDMGGRTRKFLCKTSDGQSLRIKYFERGDDANREVFAEVAATRLLWALGFDADAVFPVNVICVDCPEDPWTGKGPRARREYVASYEARYEGTTIAPVPDPDHGWTFGELETAIAGLPAGELRTRQQMHFDALSLAAVLIQHGDRKRAQQRLVCRGAVEPTRGDVREVPLEEREGTIAALFERPGAPVCDGFTVATLQDVGATFGGAGKTTNKVKAKMHLASWAERPVFDPGGAHGAAGCRGRIAVSGAAGNDARPDPTISEAGRQFLAGQLKRLTPDLVRTLFELARVDQMGERHEWRDRTSGRTYTGIDAWVAVFLDKVAQIDRQRCGS
ncbi:MAG TPA: hypothetical protein VFJ02_22290 [Vicinamibacterales bacterium]|nr:hypothetical protein [Vicinamibacterales bacterium]